MENFIFNPELTFANKEFKGNTLYNGRFTNTPYPETDASFFNVLKWKFRTNPQKQEKEKENFKLTIIKNNDLFEEHSSDKIVWLGHSSFLIRVNKTNILFDPVFGDLPFLKRKVAIPFSVDQVRNIDYLLFSHGHRDHFDNDSVKKVLSQNPQVEVLVPLKLGSLVKELDGNIKVQEAGWYQNYKIEKSLEITFLPAVHWHRRGLGDYNNILWGSFFIKTPSWKIYFGGDTAYASHFKEIRKHLGEPDYCLLPIGAYKPSFIMKKSHMNPHEAIMAFKDLNGKKFIPMHYGTFDLADEPLGEPIKIIKENLNQSQLVNLGVGEIFNL